MADNTLRNAGIVGLLLLFAFRGKSKKKVDIIIEDPVPAKSNDADFLVQIEPGTNFYNVFYNKVGINQSPKTIYLDGFKNFGDYPNFVWVRDKLGNYMFVKRGQYKIVGQ